ncbi:amidase signature enzyme [Guyanagaster necrorhizus]|uniref:Glutamyl-tRNA(Gln) amidotransferase subunit A, mitochondrial n=1 Tax=Guyanagaster necrorhizus TaxID=856835 RepID=A0A9P7VSD3_9AGAR|nr:amidase signature enzyme [Guyanagaster necrorhizus MCA 3950]KAG7445109.1 amidase signature enzyme [Guyanagaster necrorhizus MCA 3950]
MNRGVTKQLWTGLRCLYTSSTRTISSSSNQAFLDKNSSINAFVCTNDAVEYSGDHFPLGNVIIGVKDNICTSKLPTTCSSAILQGFLPPFNATVVKLLEDAGAVMLGKTNCDEFGMGSLNVHSVHGSVVNPFQHPSSTLAWENRERRSAGGSSGGSAAVVAAKICDAAIGTDTGGSIRLPAAYCGVVGLKPSYGLLSRWGVVSYADSLDCVGIIAKDISTTKRVFDVLNVHDERDPTCTNRSIRREASHAVEIQLKSWSNLKERNLHGIKIGIPEEYFPFELSGSVVKNTRSTIVSLKSLGATIVPVSLKSTSFALSAYYVIASAEASSNLARYDGIQYGLHIKPPLGADLTKTSKIYAHTRSKGFGSEVQKRILLGTYSLTADSFDNYFLQALRVRRLVRDDFDRVFRMSNVRVSNQIANADGVDVLMHPSAIRTAPLLDGEEDSSGLEAYVQDVLTVPASLAGLPAISVPITNKEDDGWPVGISIVGQWGCDDMVMKIGEVIESLNSNL